MSRYLERDCDKKRHHNLHGAKLHIRHLIENGVADSGELFPYHCRDCGFIHVGHPDEAHVKERTHHRNKLSRKMRDEL